ncbi:MAG: peptide ABC transporter substrate-binding protein, partial [Pseudomonadota bacterium]|nr:peptide ABC transporter substrate-binding protein [Pseudomonadota bacterium]
MLKTLIKLTAGVSLAALLTSGAFAQVVYNRGNDTDPTSLDHHKTSTVAEANLMRDLYEGLVIHNGRAEVVPGVAESWEVSDDGKVYTFKLRQ